MNSVIHIINSVGPNSFGLGTAALSLVKHQLAAGGDSRIWCTDSTSDAAWAAEASGLESETIHTFRKAFLGFPGYSPAMEQAARRVPSRPDVVHQHSIWSGLSRVTLEWRKRGVPTVVAAHGALQPWALRKSALKKRLAALGWESQNLHGAACLHACGENEIDDYRRFELRNPVALLPNAISQDWIDSHGNGNQFRERCGIPRDKRVLLYLSRITPKKGLPLLLEAISELGERFKPWMLLIAGTDEFGHRAQLEQAIRRLKLKGSVLFADPQYGQQKRAAYAAADLFVLPTYSEGSPMVVLEALGAGVPVLTTKGTPWADLERHRCGWWCDISASAIHSALSSAVGLSPEELREAGARGRSLVASKYSWTEIASRTLRLYNWLAGRGERPEFVYVV